MKPINEPAPAAPGILVPVGGVPMHALVRGRGGPAVVLESGAGGSVLEWAQVAQALSADTTVVMRDRPGFAWSAYARRDRSALAAAQDLRELLERLRIPGPYVLVGHSLGGLHVRAFAALFPKEVTGMVLVDASHERVFDGQALLVAQIRMFRWLIALRPLLGRERLRTLYKRAMMPPADGEPSAEIRRIFATFDAMDRRGGPWFAGIRDEYGAVLKSCEQLSALRASSPFPQVPLRVLSQGRSYADKRMHFFGERMRALHADLASLSPDSQHLIAERSGHLIQLDQPELVVGAVRDVLRACA